MDSDDSRDSSSSDSDADIGTERPPDSPDSVDSYGTGPMSRAAGPKSPSIASRLEPRGPRSPPECSIESPSPDDRSRSVNSIADSHNSVKSPVSRRSISSDRDSVKSIESIKSRGSDKSAVSNKSAGSDKSLGSIKSTQSNKSVVSDKHSIKSPDSDKSCSPHLRSVESRSSHKSNDSCRHQSKSPSSDRELNRSKSRSSDRGSVVSAGSIKSQSSGGRSPRSPSPSSVKSSQRNEDGNSSDSSASSQDSSRRRKSNFLNVNSSGVPLEEQAEEISDAEMDLDTVKDSDHCDTTDKPTNVMNISHEDLSDVSDLESMGERSEDENNAQSSPPQKNSAPSPVPPPRDLRQKLDEAKNRKLVEAPKLPEKTSKTEDGEEALDFEAEDGECDPEPARPDEISETQEQAPEEGEETEKEQKKEEEPEEGEVTDDDEARPEETEPRPVCRFYSRGQCTWGASCRFLHPGVTDKGNYTMFEMIRPVVPGPPIGYGGPDYRDERPVPFGHPIRPAEVPVAESAWERGLRTAKEMVRRAIKRKEQDMDFEEKKMNLTLSQDELDKENGYYTRAPSPILIEPSPPPVKHYVRHQPAPVLHDPYYGPHAQRHPQEEYYRRIHHFEPEPPPARQVRIEPEFDNTVTRDRVRTYRELPAHRMPDYYNDKYEERTVTISSGNKQRHSRPKREVIVQRMEQGSSSRGDEWADPWMRSKSPGGRRTGARRQSYSSGSSYSSSSSSRSSSASSRSSYRRTGGVHHSRSQSRSVSPKGGTRRHHAAVPEVPSPHGITRHRNVSGHATHERRSGRSGPETSSRRPRISPSVIVSERRAAHERALLMNPPAPSPRKAHRETRPPSPGMMRTSAQNPPAPIKVPSTDQFGRTTKRELAMERRQLDPDRKKLVVAAALAARVKSRAVRSSHSSSGSDSSGSSSSDSESSYSSSSSSHEGSATSAKRTSDNRMELAAFALKAKAIDALKGDRVPIENKKRPAQSPPAEAPAPKIAALSKTSTASTGTASAGGKKQTSRREELLKQLKAVEDAIAKKRSKVN